MLYDDNMCLVFMLPSRLISVVYIIGKVVRSRGTVTVFLYLIDIRFYVQIMLYGSQYTGASNGSR